MNRKRLIAALGELRAKIARLEDMLERGDDSGALDLIADAEDDWSAALQEIRS